mgnify:CR=1 FL=1
MVTAGTKEEVDGVPGEGDRARVDRVSGVRRVGVETNVLVEERGVLLAPTLEESARLLVVPVGSLSVAFDKEEDNAEDDDDDDDDDDDNDVERSLGKLV